MSTERVRLKNPPLSLAFIGSASVETLRVEGMLGPRHFR